MAHGKPRWGSHQSLESNTSMTNSPERTKAVREYVPDNSISVYVSNLPPKTQFFTFAGHFSSYKSLVALKLLPLKAPDAIRAGLVSFESATDAENAIRDLNHQPPFNMQLTYNRKQADRSVNKNSENGQFSDNYFHGNGEDTAGLNYGRMNVKINSGCDGRRVVVNDNPGNCISERPAFCAWKKKTDVTDGRGLGGPEEKQYRDHNACGDGFNRRWDRQRLSERSKKFDFGQRQNGNTMKELNSDRYLREDYETMVQSKQRTNDFNKNRQRAKSCERFLSNRNNYDDEDDEIESEFKPAPSDNQVCNRKSRSSNYNRFTRNRHAEDNSSSDESLLHVDSLTLKLGSTTRCTVTHVENNGIFWAQPNPGFANKLEISLGEEAKRAPERHVNPRSGGIYLVQYDSDSLWYRGKIVKLNDNRSVDVLFIDYGNSSFNVPSIKVKPLALDKCKYPAQAIKCKPSQTTVKHYATPQAFSAAIVSNDIDLTVESIHNDYHVVTVDISSGGKTYNATEQPKPSPQSNSPAVKEEKETPSTIKQSMSDIMLSLRRGKQRSETQKLESVNDKPQRSEPDADPTPTPLLSPEEVDRNERPTSVQNSDEPPTVQQPKDYINLDLREQSKDEPKQLFSVKKMNDEPKQLPSVKKMNDEPKQLPSVKKMNDEPKPLPSIKKINDEPRQLPSVEKIEQLDNAAQLNGSFECIISQLSVGDTFDLVPMVPDSPLTLWGTVNYADSLAKLANGFDSFYEELPETLIDVPIVGSLIAAKSSIYGNWGRVIVLSSATEELEVFFVDFGSKENVAVIKPLAERHKKLPGLGVYCEIDDRTALKEEEKKALTNCLGEDAPFRMTVSKKIDSDTIRAEMLEHKKIPCLLKSGQFMIGRKNELCDSLITTENLARFEKDLTCDTLLVSVLSSNQINVCPTQFFEEIVKIEDLPSSSEEYNPTVKELILAKFSETGKMYRGEVLQVEKDHALVFFIDYGNQEKVLFKDISPYTPELLKIPLCIVAVKNRPQLAEILEPFISDTLKMNIVDNDCLPAVVEFFKNNVNILAEG